MGRQTKDPCGCGVEIHWQQPEPGTTGFPELMVQPMVYCPLHAQAGAMRDLLQRIADGACNHGTHEFCPRNEAYRLLKTIKAGA